MPLNLKLLNAQKPRQKKVLAQQNTYQNKNNRATSLIQFWLRLVLTLNILSQKILNNIIPSVHKMVKQTLKILQQLPQNFQRVSDHFEDTSHNRFNC